MTTEKPEPLNLDSIREKVARYQNHRDFLCCSAHGPADHVPVLVAEIERLRARLAEHEQLALAMNGRLAAEVAELRAADLSDEGWSEEWCAVAPSGRFSVIGETEAEARSVPLAPNESLAHRRVWYGPLDYIEGT